MSLENLKLFTDQKLKEMEPMVAQTEAMQRLVKFTLDDVTKDAAKVIAFIGCLNQASMDHMITAIRVDPLYREVDADKTIEFLNKLRGHVTLSDVYAQWEIREPVYQNHDDCLTPWSVQAVHKMTHRVMTGQGSDTIGARIDCITKIKELMQHEQKQLQTTNQQLGLDTATSGRSQKDAGKGQTRNG